MITEQERIVRRSQGYDIGFEYNGKRYWINSYAWNGEKEERLFQETGLRTFRETIGEKNLVLYDPQYFNIHLNCNVPYLHFHSRIEKNIPQPINMSSAFGMFYNSHVSELDLSDWDMSNVTYYLETFAHCASLTRLNLAGWDVHNVSNINNMFYGCKSLRHLDLAGWDIELSTRAQAVFVDCRILINIYCEKDEGFAEFYNQYKLTDLWCMSLLHLIIADSNKYHLEEINTF